MSITILLIWWHKINNYAHYEHIVFKDRSHFRHSVNAADVAEADYDDYDGDDNDDEDNDAATGGDDDEIPCNTAEKSRQYQIVANMFKSNLILFNSYTIYFWPNHEDLTISKTL